MLDSYLAKFGETFYKNVIMLIDDRVKKNQIGEARLNETYEQMGLIGSEDDALQEFKDFFHELTLQIDQYKEETSRFYGREHLLEKVLFICRLNIFTPLWERLLMFSTFLESFQRSSSSRIVWHSFKIRLRKNYFFPTFSIDPDPLSKWA